MKARVHSLHSFCRLNVSVFQNRSASKFSAFALVFRLPTSGVPATREGASAPPHTLRRVL